MKSKEKITITVKTIVNAPIEMVWKLWTTPKDIMKWNQASDDWHTTKAENDLRTGGKFNYRMEAKDGSFGFDFYGVYEKVILHSLIDILLGDERKLKITFSEVQKKTEVTESFEAEDENSAELQRGGWQAILDNFKKYAETNK